VQVRDLARHFDVSAPWLNRMLERQPRQWLHAVDGVDFAIERGQTMALVGESGCGKSTVARLLVGLYQPSRGQVQFDGQDAHAAFAGRDALVLRRRIQMIFQDPYASLNPRWTVGDVVAEPLREHGLAPTRAAAQDAVVGCCNRSVWARLTWASTRTSSRAGSASASPLPAPWPPHLNFWSATNPPRRWT
jgi:peptide/nickel transport system ATP-binding protein